MHLFYEVTVSNPFLNEYNYHGDFNSVLMISMDQLEMSRTEWLCVTHTWTEAKSVRMTLAFRFRAQTQIPWKHMQTKRVDWSAGLVWGRRDYQPETHGEFSFSFKFRKTKENSCNYNCSPPHDVLWKTVSVRGSCKFGPLMSTNNVWEAECAQDRPKS